MFYLLGSMLFVLAMAAALMVMMTDLGRYRHAMAAALRTLSLDGWSPPVQEERPLPRPALGQARPMPAPMRQRQAVASLVHS